MSDVFYAMIWFSLPHVNDMQKFDIEHRTSDIGHRTSQNHHSSTPAAVA